VLTKRLPDSNIYLAVTENRSGGGLEKVFQNLENFIV